MAGKRVNVLLLSPGYAFARDGNFSNTHLVALGSYLQARTDARVQIIDLDYEAKLPAPAPQRMFSTEFDLIGISCYSSYEYLKSFYLGVEIRRRHPSACLVVGGYHPSARPSDFTGPESPFDHVVMGEGELPLARIVVALEQRKRLSERIFQPEVVEELDSLPPLDWTLLDRYKPIARRIGGQATLYLSRGCPFRCVFCMEAAKGIRTWRAFSPERAEAELLNLHRYLDLSGWKLFFTDPLFGIQREWRREMLARIDRLALPVTKYWALTRADILDESDIPRFHRANIGLGFGLESGDPAILKIIHKGGDPAAYLEKFLALARLASEIDFPWGANVIAGHPGETPQSLTRSAEWIGEMIRSTPAPTGFVSIDPFRFYPGAPIDQNFAHYASTYGTVVHRERWWNYSEPEFTSEWVDPSRELDYRTRTRMTAELFLPLVEDLARRYAYRGPGSDYFRRSVDVQAQILGRRARLGTLHRYFLWRGLTGHRVDDIRRDGEIAAMLLGEREAAVARVEAQFGEFPSAVREALIAVRRELFVSADQLWRSSQDEALPLTQDGLSTISALHAYGINYRLLALSEGDHLLEFGGGTGYGAAIAAQVVGRGGRVISVEVHEALARLAGENLAQTPQVTVMQQLDGAPAGVTKIVFCFAVEAIPEVYLAALPVGGRLLAPLVGDDGAQTLTLACKTDAGVTLSAHGSVRYVPRRDAGGA